MAVIFISQTRFECGKTGAEGADGTRIDGAQLHECNSHLERPLPLIARTARMDIVPGPGQRGREQSEQHCQSHAKTDGSAHGRFIEG